MTREDAINELKILKEDYWDDDGYGHETKQYDDTLLALDMAIKALEQEPDTWSLEDAREDFVDDVYNTLDFLPTNDEANQIIDSFDRVTSSIRREPCENCISRADVLDLAKKGVLISNSNYQSVCKAINELPSVTPTRKKMMWEFEKSIFDNFGLTVICPSCRKRWKTYDEIRWKKENKYCPNCGARMTESEEKE